MATDCDDRAHIGPAHVDNKIVQEVLRAATGVVISGAFILFLLHNHFITENKFKKNPAM